MPAARCQSTWQCTYQIPGLFASKTTVTVERPGSSTVSRRAPFYRLAVDLDNLKRVAVQMHGMSHRGLVDEFQRHALTEFDADLRWLRAGIVDVEDHAINRPFVAHHVAGQAQFLGAIDLNGGFGATF